MADKKRPVEARNRRISRPEKVEPRKRRRGEETSPLSAGKAMHGAAIAGEKRPRKRSDAEQALRRAAGERPLQKK